MSRQSCESLWSWNTLIDYWLGELAPAAEADVEEHYLGCARCSQRLEQLAAIGRGLRLVARTSGVDMFIIDEFVRRLTQDGLRVREYRVPRGGSVNCTATPEDDFVVGRLEAPLDGVQRVDMVTLDPEGHAQTRQQDVPFVAASGGVVFCPGIAKLRSLSFTTWRVRLLAVDERGDHPLGDYTFNHTPNAAQSPRR